jgi:hypothetical protein
MFRDGCLCLEGVLCDSIRFDENDVKGEIVTNAVGAITAYDDGQPSGVGCAVVVVEMPWSGGNIGRRYRNRHCIYRNHCLHKRCLSCSPLPFLSRV